MDTRKSRIAVAGVVTVLLASSCAEEQPAPTASVPTTASSSTSTTTSSPTPSGLLPAIGEIDRWDGLNLIVWVDVDAGDQAHREIAAMIDREPGLRLVEYFDQEATYDEFREAFADTPEMVAVLTAEQVPPSYRLWVDEEQRPLGEAGSLFRGLPGVRSVVTPAADEDPAVQDRIDMICAGTQLPGVDLIVWLDAAASESDHEDVRAMLRPIEGLSWSYIDAEATYAEFLELFRDAPPMPETVTADMLPTSYRVLISGDRSIAQQLADAFVGKSGVREVVTAWNSC